MTDTRVGRGGMSIIGNWDMLIYLEKQKAKNSQTMLLNCLNAPSLDLLMPSYDNDKSELLAVYFTKQVKTITNKQQYVAWCISTREVNQTNLRLNIIALLKESGVFVSWV